MNKIKLSVVFILAVAMLSIASLHISAQTTINAEDFKNPPNSAKPHTWWHWVDGHVSKEGITKDMEAWKEVGIGGFQHFSIGWKIPFGGTEYHSPEFHEYMAHAMSEAERLGLEAGFHSASGWSCTGGPWIKPEHSMKMIV
ncbi:MAG: Tat pathway signal protein, partial [Deltaproteobacteria bacterium]|nr:Tat pathway signal protein [Deltaproteobacteria bacterium]